MKLLRSPRLDGKSEKLGPVTISHEFIDWEVMDVDRPERMRRALNEMARRSVMLDAGMYGGVDLVQARASFIEQEDFSYGRDNSRRHIRFGQMLINSGPRSALFDEPEFVAIKPFNDRSELYTEWAAAAYLNDRYSRQMAFINLGVHNDKNGIESIISNYEHGVVSLDRSFNADELSPAAARRPEILRKHALLGMEGLGLYHGVRMTHGDAQAKNLAYDSLGPRAIDLESATIYSEEDSYSDDIWDRSRRDISAFIDSMVLVEENRQNVIRSLGSGRVLDAMIAKYRDGVMEGRSVMGGEYVPDFARDNADTIRDEYLKIIR